MEPKTHDYRRGNRGWGHDYTVSKVIDGGQKLDAMGWGTGLQKGDYLLMQSNSESGETRYQITDISYFRDPEDMWSATLEFAPRG